MARQELRIQDFALVTRQTVKFTPGLNAITGESGAGKSVLIEALGQLLGAPAPPECVRAPAAAAVIEGVIALSPEAAAAVAALGAELGLPPRALPAGGGGGEPARLLLRREVGRGGGGRGRGCVWGEGVLEGGAPLQPLWADACARLLQVRAPQAPPPPLQRPHPPPHPTHQPR
jgi:hypothetical protein